MPVVDLSASLDDTRVGQGADTRLPAYVLQEGEPTEIGGAHYDKALVVNGTRLVCQAVGANSRRRGAINR